MIDSHDAKERNARDFIIFSLMMSRFNPKILNSLATMISHQAKREPYVKKNHILFWPSAFEFVGK